jgi:hypothetical protein
MLVFSDCHSSVFTPLEFLNFVEVLVESVDVGSVLNFEEQLESLVAPGVFGHGAIVECGASTFIHF